MSPLSGNLHTFTVETDVIVETLRNDVMLYLSEIFEELHDTMVVPGLERGLSLFQRV